MSDSKSSDHQQIENRLEKLEESVGYADRTIEVLSGEIAEMSKLVLGLGRRMSHLENRLSELNDRVGDDVPHVPPPHSAGPDIPKDPL